MKELNWLFWGGVAAGVAACSVSGEATTIATSSFLDLREIFSASSFEDFESRDLPIFDDLWDSFDSDLDLDLDLACLSSVKRFEEPCSVEFYTTTSPTKVVIISAYQAIKIFANEFKIKKLRSTCKTCSFWLDLCG